MTLANMGLPMIAVVWPVGWLLIIPIILVEWLLACRMLKIPSLKGLEVAGIGNLASTFLAVPVTWGVMLVLALVFPYSDLDSFLGVINNVVLHSAWLAPWRGESHWMVPAAALTLCVPFYFASVGVEYAIARGLLASRFPTVRCGSWAWKSNGLTYGAIATCLIGMTLFNRLKS